MKFSGSTEPMFIKLSEIYFHLSFLNPNLYFKKIHEQGIYDSPDPCIYSLFQYWSIPDQKCIK